MEKLYEFHVRPEIAAYNKALLETDLTDEEEPVTQRWTPEPLDEDWPGQLRKTSLLMGLVALIVASTPIALVLVWALSNPP